MQLTLVRHPQPVVASGVCYGHTDLACAADVLEHAALALLHTLPQGQRIITSPLQRCERLAQRLSGLARHLTYETDARLAEMHFGAWEMQAWDAIGAQALQAWTDDFAHHRCGGFGESTAQFICRVAQRLRQSARSGQDQVWITHAGVVHALVWLQQQPIAWIEALFDTLAQAPKGSEALAPSATDSLWRDQLRASDWPRAALGFGQVQRWNWPQHWPQS
jgi:alpha-ribazole phosphatase